MSDGTNKIELDVRPYPPGAVGVAHHQAERIVIEAVHLMRASRESCIVMRSIAEKILALHRVDKAPYVTGGELDPALRSELPAVEILRSLRPDYWQTKTLPEIGKILGVGEETAKALLHREGLKHKPRKRGLKRGQKRTR
jgi:hypothetical protein